MKKVIVTGATGYIGSNLVKKLLEMNMEVHIITRSTSKFDLLNGFKNKLNIFEYNNSIQNMIDYFKQVKADIVFHLAASCIVEHKPEDINNLLQSNIEFGTNILEAMAKSNTKRIVNTGTIFQNYKDENYNPTSLYGATKEAFEKILEYYVEAENFSAITLKLFGTYGRNDLKGEVKGRVLSLFNKISFTNESIDMTLGEQYMDLVYIDDVVNAFICASDLTDNNLKQHKKYFVKTGKLVKLKDLAKLYENIFNVKLNINWGDREYRKREIMMPYEDGETLPNWEPSLMIEDGLKHLYKLKQNDPANKIDVELENIDSLIEQGNVDEACNRYINLINNNEDAYLAKVYKNFAQLLFDCQCYEESLDMFVNAYELDYMKNDIEQFIYKSFLEPNIDYFKECYKNNLLQCENGKTILEKYPFETLPLDFIPTLQDKYYIFDKENHKFISKYNIIEYEKSSYLEYKYSDDEFSDIAIYEQWDYENIRKYLNAFVVSNRKVYVVVDDLPKLISFFKFSDLYTKELKDVKLFSSLEDFRNFFETNKSVYLPLNIISADETKKEKLTNVIKQIHQKRLTKEYRDESNILLTICIPSYNRGHRALADIKELCKLKYDAEIEFLVSNNASTKNIEEYKEIQAINDARVSYYELEVNQGFAANVCNVVKMAKGKFALLISDEDMILVSNLPHYMRRLKNEKGIGMIATKWRDKFYLKNAHFKKGNEAILNYMFTDNDTSGDIFNNELVKNNNIISWLEQKQSEQDNIAFAFYSYQFLGLILATLGDIIVDETVIISAGKSESESEVLGINANNNVDIPQYASYESRIKQMNNWSNLIKEIANEDSLLIRKLFLKLCSKTFGLISMHQIKSKYILHGYNWAEICDKVYDACLESMESLYENMSQSEKINDKRILEQIRDSVK